MNRLLVILLTLIPIAGALPGQESTYQKRLKIEDPGGTEIISIKYYADKIKVEIPGTALEAPSAPKDRKRKYRNGSSTFAEVTFSETGMKLRSNKGTLLWKVKYKGNDIEISDNEEMIAPYRIRHLGSKLKLSENGADVAEVKWYPDNRKLKLKKMDGTEWYVAKTDRISPAMALPGCRRIEKAHQAILIAELENSPK